MKFIVVVLGVGLFLVLTGCAGNSVTAGPGLTSKSEQSTSSTPSRGPSSSDVLTGSPTATPSALSTQSDGAVTCESLLEQATVKKGTAAGGVISEFTAQQASNGGTLAKFIEYGGIACDFGPKQSDSPVLYGYGPISEAKAENEMAHLANLGLPTGTNEHGGTFFGRAGDQEIFVFSPKGYWAYQYNNGFGTQLGIDAIEEVVANAPTFY